MKEADPVPPLTTSDRVFRSVIAGGALGVATFLIWATVQFSVAANLRGNISETVGLSAIIVAPIAAAVAVLAGLAIGALSRKGKLRWNLLWAQLVFILICAGLITCIVWIPANSQSKPPPPLASPAAPSASP